MFRKIVTGLILVPLAIVIIAFAVANRQMVTVSFDPFSSASPAYAATLPLFGSSTCTKMPCNRVP